MRRFLLFISALLIVVSLGCKRDRMNPLDPEGELRYDEAEFTNITSPFYTNNYTANYDQTVIITKINAVSMAVHFERIDTETNVDIIYIRTGSGTIITQLSGFHEDLLVTNIAGTTVRVQFTSDSFNEYSGWKIDYVAWKTN